MNDVIEPSNPKSFTLTPLIDCTIEQQLAVLEIRNQDGVRKSMYTEHIIQKDEHLAWIERLKTDNRQQVFAVLDGDGKPVGLVSLNAIDVLHKKADWAFYLDEKQRGGLGVALEFQTLNYAFGVIGLKKLNCEVIETNTQVVRLHKKFGFIEEGFRRENIEKNGERIGVTFLGITDKEWEEAGAKFGKTYRAVLDNFQLKINQN